MVPQSSGRRRNVTPDRLRQTRARRDLPVPLQELKWASTVPPQAAARPEPVEELGLLPRELVLGQDPARRELGEALDRREHVAATVRRRSRRRTEGQWRRAGRARAEACRGRCAGPGGGCADGRGGGSSGPVAALSVLRRPVGRRGGPVELAREGQRLVAALRLRRPADAVLPGVVDGDRPVTRHREPPRAGEDRIAHVVLRPRRRRRAELRRPPVGKRLRLEGASRRDQPGQIGAERVDARLQRVVEHVADHHHAAARPLAEPAELGLVELDLPAAGARQGGGQPFGRRDGHAMPRRDLRSLRTSVIRHPDHRSPPGVPATPSTHTPGRHHDSARLPRLGSLFPLCPPACPRPIFLATAPGLEPLLRAEAVALGLPAPAGRPRRRHPHRRLARGLAREPPLPRRHPRPRPHRRVPRPPPRPARQARPQGPVGRHPAADVPVRIDVTTRKSRIYHAGAARAAHRHRHPRDPRAAGRSTPAATRSPARPSPSRSASTTTSAPSPSTPAARCSTAAATSRR